MSTIGTIQFKGKHETIYLCRDHDGFPEDVLPDLERVTGEWHGQLPGPEVALLVSVFLGETWTRGAFHDYELAQGLRGDESYLFSVRWREKTPSSLPGWECSVVDDFEAPETNPR